MRLQAGVVVIIALTLWLSTLSDADSHVCGHRPTSGSLHSRRKRVIGGNEAPQNSWPWMVNFIDHTSRQQCAGTIIDREWILTAGHCFVRPDEVFPLTNYTYHVADHYLNTTDHNEYKIDVSKLYAHPKYIIGSFNAAGDYDIALIKLSTPLNYSKYVRPVCLAKEDDMFSKNDSCFVTGWGNDRNTHNYSRSPFLKEARVDFVGLEECNSKMAYKGMVNNRSLCAGFKEGGVDACYGDSGGPLQCNRNGTWVQIGITIWGIGCAEPNHYGVYTSVSVLQPFIKAIMSGPNTNLTMYLMKTLDVVQPDVANRPTSNLHQLLTRENEFSNIDLVRNLQLLPSQIRILNKTSLMDLIFVTYNQNVTANATTLSYIAELLVAGQADRLTVYYRGKAISKEFNISFEDVYKSSNLTKDEFLNSKFNIIDKTRKKLYIKRYVRELFVYKDILMTYKAGLNVTLDSSKVEKDLNKPVKELKDLSKKSLKQVLVKHNTMVFTKMLSIRNISSFFETSLAKLKETTVADVLMEYLKISPTSFASLYNLTSKDIDVVKMYKISIVSYPDDQSLHDLVMEILGSYRNSRVCGIRQDSASHMRSKRVIGGREAGENSWPWIVSFVEQGLQYCAGAIIDHQWILTAGHCFVLTTGMLPLANYTYHVGDHRLNFTDPHEYTVNASKLFIHPRYIGGTGDHPGNYDIAMIELEKPLTFGENVRPVCVPEEGNTLNENETCYVTGWGNTKNAQGYHRSPVLKEAEVPLVSHAKCNSNTSYKGVIPDKFICAGYDDGGVDSCYGDSGGPFQCYRNGSWVQIGIVSWGKGCAEPNHYGVYSNVHALLPFINAVKSGPNMALTQYHLKTLQDVIPDMQERSFKNMRELLTNNTQFSSLDVLRNIQLTPHQFKVLNKTTLAYVKTVSGKNVTANGTMLKYIVEVFVDQTDRLNMFIECKALAKQLNISCDRVISLSGVEKDAFLDSKPAILKEVTKTFELNKQLEKLREYREDLLAYKDNINVTLDLIKVRMNFSRLSLDKIKAINEKELKAIILKENMMLFTKILTLRNISTFLDIPRESLQNMTVPRLLSQVLRISHDDFTKLHMFTSAQLEMIKDDKISTLDRPDDQSLYEITKAILQAKGKSKSCDDCSKNAECKATSDNLYRCRCRQGYIGDGVKCDSGNKIYSSELVLSQTFTESLNDPNSMEYKNLAEKIQSGLTNAIERNSFPEFLGCQVTGFKNGSVIAQYVLVFELQETESVDVSKLSDVISTAVKNGSLAIPVASLKPLTLTDLCTLGSHGCHEDATCKIENGILTCKCKEDFYGDGKMCIDSCVKEKCPVDSYCFRGLGGSAKCICDPGYAEEEGKCEKTEDFKTALIVVCCVAGTLLLLALMICWYQYCNRNRKESLEMNSTTIANKGRENSAYDTINLDRI